MRDYVPTTAHYDPWPHRLAIVLVCATFPLIWVGGLVTTYDAGMAVPDWPTTYGYNMFAYPITTWLAGPWDLFIEHGHRLLASGVGLLTIGLLCVVWRREPRPWMKWYVLGCLCLVIAQGVLGGLRVIFDQTTLARVHGCVGPLFFAATVGAAAFTSRWWQVAAQQRQPLSGTNENTRDIRQAGLLRLAWLTTGLTYVQLVLGAHLRHVSPDWSPQAFRVVVLGHLLGAALVCLHGAAVVWRGFRLRDGQIKRHVVWPATWLGILICLQLLLGAGSWRLKYHWPEWLPQPAAWQGATLHAEGMLQSVVVTAHVAVGSLILAVSLLVALRATRVIQASRTVPVVASLKKSREILV